MRAVWPGRCNKDAYLGIVAEAGFANISIKKEKVYAIPDCCLLQYLSQDEIDDYRNSGVQILSITVYGEKPSRQLHRKF